MYKCTNCNNVFADEECNTIKYREYPGASCLAEEDTCPYCRAGSYLWEDIGDIDDGDISGENRAIEAQERGICDCETDYGDRDY